jgi:hypothetical protein
MGSWLDVKYMGLLSGRLRNFKKKNGSLYQFSCPICGDSEKRRTLARGYVYQKGVDLMFHCHNCGTTLPFGKFLRDVDSGLYDDYKLEKLMDRAGMPPTRVPMEIKTRTVFPVDPLRTLRRVSELSPEDPCRRFVDSRAIPTDRLPGLYECPNFFRYTNSLLPNKFPESMTRVDETRLLIPFRGRSGNVHAYQGRSLSRASQSMKYVTIVLDPDVPKVYGLDTVDGTKTVYVLEGPIDSMFIPNSIAVAGGDLTTAPRFDRVVLIYDNEPRSKFTVQKMKKAVNGGHTVCIWPESFDKKDVNDMVLAGISPEKILETIDAGSVSGLSALAAIQQWKRVSD